MKKNNSQFLMLVIFINLTFLFASQSSNNEKQNIQNKSKFDKFVIAYTSDKNGNPDIYISDLDGTDEIKLTDYKLRDGYPDCSPDGKKIAFYVYQDEGKTWSIFVMNRDGSGRSRLTTEKNVFDAMPRWSSDGKMITFSRSSPDWTKNEIWVMNSDGTNQRKIKNIEGFTPSFTKDGNIIYYTHWDESGEIFISNLEGKILKQLTNNNYTDGKPDISPDGNKIVFQSKKYGNSELFTMDMNGENLTRLTYNPNVENWQPRWSPDGRKILFGAMKDGKYDVLVMNADGTNIKNITKGEAKAGQGTWMYKLNNPKQSKKYVIAYSSARGENPDIYYSDLDGNKIKRITERPLRDGYPCCSPNGEKIVFYAYDDDGKTWSIFVMNRDGSGRKRLTFEKNVFDSSPRWSADSKKIIFDRSSSDWEINKIWIMDSDGSNQKEIPNISGLTPSFTPQGNIIYYTDWNESGEICIADTEGNILEKLTNNNTLDSKPEISPDGSKIIFASDRDGNREIYLMNIDGSNPVNLSNHPGKDGGPRWSPDGSKIIFISNRDGHYQVYVMNADGTNVRNVSQSKYNDIQATWLY